MKVFINPGHDIKYDSGAVHYDADGNVDLRDLTACHRTCVGHGKRYAMFIGGQIGVGKLRIA